MNSEIIGLRLHFEHLRQLQNYMQHFINLLLIRLVNHDFTKLSRLELGLIKGKEELETVEYNSPEYHQLLADVKTSLDHHYLFYD